MIGGVETRWKEKRKAHGWEQNNRKSQQQKETDKSLRTKEEIEVRKDLHEERCGVCEGVVVKR